VLLGSARLVTQSKPPTNPQNSSAAPTASRSPPSSVAAGVHAALAQTPQGVAQQLQTQIQTMMQLQLQGHGPFPPAAAVKEYEAILPGFLERILTMAEKAQNDQSETVRFAQQAQRRDTARVHWLAFGISTMAVAGAGYCVWVHAQVAATVAFLGVPLLSVAKAFIDSLRAPQLAQLQQQAQQQQLQQMQKILVEQQAAAVTKTKKA
jgi:uncharacterized membrane protein